MEENKSILTSIKKLLGITEEYTHFDSDLVMHINSVFSILTQLGMGPSIGFMIEDEKNTWDEFVPEERGLELVKSYVYLKVKLLFDPPTSSALSEATNKMVDELEWRIFTNIELNTTDGGRT